MSEIHVCQILAYLAKVMPIENEVRPKLRLVVNPPVQEKTLEPTINMDSAACTKVAKG